METPVNDSESSFPERNITALYLSKKTLGVATFVEIENKIWVDFFPYSVEDSEQLLEFIKLVSETKVFVLSPTIINNRNLTSAIVRGIDGTENYYQIKALGSTSWNMQYAKNLIRNMLKVGQIDFINERHKTLDIVLDDDNPEMTCSLGGLVYFLSKEVYYLDKERITIASISSFPVDCYMRADSNTLKALQIMKEEFHPNWLKGKGRSKEGFSLFGLLDRTVTPAGRRKLNDWMRKPFNDLDRILSRQNDVEFFLSEENAEFCYYILDSLKSIKDIQRIMLRLKRAEIKQDDWCKIYFSISAMIEMIERLKRLSEYGNIEKPFSFVYSTLTTASINPLKEVVTKLYEVIDINESEARKQLVIRQGYNTLLDEKLYIYEGLEQDLIHAAEAILECTPSIRNLSVEYLPQLGFFVTMNEDNKSILLAENLVSNDGNMDCTFQQCFQRTDITYFKHEIVKNLDETIGDIKSDIVDLQQQCLIPLEEILIENEVLIFYFADIAATIDATISLSTIAKENNLTKPEVVDDPILIIKGGRHILQEITVDNFIPNDTFCTPEKNIALITGPNGSGKSIYLKQVGLISYLAHIGSFVPCERAIIGVIDQMFTRIASEESVLVGKSTFTIDLLQISKMLAKGTSKSLCLIDEFGKGTMPLDGMALLAAILQYFTNVQSRVYCVLHFTEILDEKLFPREVASHFNMFRMETLQEHPAEEGSVIPLFKLRCGIDRDPLGIKCAELMGMKKNVINRALEIKRSIIEKTPIAPIENIRPLREHELALLRKLRDLLQIKPK
jgi:DNA mismatch repair protein MSH5